MIIVLNLLEYLQFTRDLEELGLTEEARETALWIGGGVLAIFAAAGFMIVLFGALVPYMPITAISLGLLTFVGATIAEYALGGFPSPRSLIIDVMIFLALIYGLYAAITKKRTGKDPSLEENLEK